MTFPSKSIYRRLGTLSLGAGIDPRKLLRTLLNAVNFPYDLFRFYRLLRRPNASREFQFPFTILPVLSDSNEDSGELLGSLLPVSELSDLHA